MKLSFAGLEEYVNDKRHKDTMYKKLTGTTNETELDQSDFYNRVFYFDLNFEKAEDFMNFFQLKNLYDLVTLKRRIQQLKINLLNKLEAANIKFYITGIAVQDVFISRVIRTTLRELLIECFCFLDQDRQEEHLVANGKFQYGSKPKKASPETRALILSTNPALYIYSNINFISLSHKTNIKFVKKLFLENLDNLTLFQFEYSNLICPERNINPVLIPMYMAYPEVFTHEDNLDKRKRPSDSIILYQKKILSTLQSINSQKLEDLKHKIEQTWKGEFVSEAQTHLREQRRNTEKQGIMFDDGSCDSDYDEVDDESYNSTNYDTESSSGESDDPHESKALDDEIKRRDRQLTNLIKRYTNNAGKQSSYSTRFEMQSIINKNMFSANEAWFVTGTGVIPAAGLQFYRSGTRRLPRLQFDEYCKEDPWQVSQKVRTIYYALLHRELSGYNPRREGEMNQVNEQSWKNPDENNNSIFYNFDHNKIETDDSFAPSQVKYSENTVIKEQFFRPASTIRKPKHKKQHFKISKDDYHSQIKETDERSLTLFSLDTLHCWWKKSLRQIHYYIAVELLQINAIKKAVDKLKLEKRPILSYGYDFWKTAMHYYVEQNSCKFGYPDMHIVLDSYVLMKTCFKCAETRPDFRKTLYFEPVFRDDRLLNEFEQLMKKKPNLAQAYCEFFAVLYDFEFLKGTLFLCHDDEFVDFGEEVEVSILKKFILWRHDAEFMQEYDLKEGISKEEKSVDMEQISENFDNISISGKSSGTVKSSKTLKSSISRNSVHASQCSLSKSSSSANHTDRNNNDRNNNDRNYSDKNYNDKNYNENYNDRNFKDNRSNTDNRSNGKYSGKIQTSKAPACIYPSVSRSTSKANVNQDNHSVSIAKSEDKFKQTLKLWDEKLKFEIIREQFLKYYPKNLYTEISGKNGGGGAGMHYG